MQLLDSEQLEFAFQLNGVSLQVQARRFYADIWQVIQDAEKAADHDVVVYERRLRHLCQSYFLLVREWRIDEEDRYDAHPACEMSMANIREASMALPAFEKQFFRYVLCYMELNRALIQTRQRVAHFAKDHNLDDYKDALSVNHGTGLLLDQAHRDVAALQKKRRHIAHIHRLLQESDPLMDSLGEALPRLLGPAGDHALTLLKGALRRCAFDQAQSIIGAWPHDTLRTTGLAAYQILQKNAHAVRIGDALVLHSGELSLLAAGLRGEEARHHAFLEKYNVPYMVFQYRALLHLGYLLGRIGSIEALIIRHAKLSSLSVRPHVDPDHAKMQEQTWLLPVRVLLETKFSTLGQIFGDMERITAVLDRYIAQTRRYMAAQRA